MLCSFMIVHKK